MTHGGKREGAGRKIGTRSRASIERERRVAATGETPLEILLEMMRQSYADVRSIARRLKAISGPGNDKAREELQAILRKARSDTHAISRDAAPYVHPKLQSVLHGQDPESPTTVIHELSEESLKRARAVIFGERGWGVGHAARLKAILVRKCHRPPARPPQFATQIPLTPVRMSTSMMPARRTQLHRAVQRRTRGEDCLFHGTRCPLQILSAGHFRMARWGTRGVSFSRSPEVADYFAGLEGDPDEDFPAIFVLNRPKLRSMYAALPYHEGGKSPQGYNDEMEELVRYRNVGHLDRLVSHIAVATNDEARLRVVSEQLLPSTQLIVV